MIDRPDQVGRLLERLDAALPIPAQLTPELQATLQEKNGITVPAACNVTWVSYAGGIICQLDAGAGMSAVFASLTHLRFDPRLPYARDVLTCQTHRVTHLRRQPQSSRSRAGSESEPKVKPVQPWCRRDAYMRAPQHHPAAPATLCA